MQPHLFFRGRPIMLFYPMHWNDSADWFGSLWHHHQFKILTNFKRKGNCRTVQNSKAMSMVKHSFFFLFLCYWRGKDKQMRQRESLFSWFIFINIFVLFRHIIVYIKRWIFCPCILVLLGAGWKLSTHIDPLHFGPSLAPKGWKLDWVGPIGVMSRWTILIQVV